MSSVKAFPLIITLFLVVIIFTGINMVGDEIITNSNLDNRSIVLIVSLDNKFNENFNQSDLVTSTSSIAENTTNEGQDAFVLQFLESKQETGKIEGFINKVTAIPDLLVLGINDDVPKEDLTWFVLIIDAFLIIMLLVAVFVAIFGEGRVT